MKNHEDHGCGTIGKWMGALFGALGVGTAFLMVYVMGIGWAIGFDAPIRVGLVVEIFAAAYLGEKGGRYLCRKGNRFGRSVLVGLGVAFGSITIAVYAGTIAGFVGYASEWMGNPDINRWNAVYALFFPLLLILLYGGLPATVLGVIYGFLLNSRLQKLDQ